MKAAAMLKMTLVKRPASKPSHTKLVSLTVDLPAKKNKIRTRIL
jgi:hypothetical protein